MRAGLFGGTFNPIHNGHLMVAGEALRRCNLDRLYIIPCRVPPHKFPDYLAPSPARVRMIEMALPADNRYCLSQLEIQRDGPSYTIDTVTQFRTAIVPEAQLLLILGMDAFLEIHTWKHQRHLLKVVQPVVVTRRAEHRKTAGDELDQLNDYIRSQLSPAYRLTTPRTAWQDDNGNLIHLLPISPVDISSTQVRARVRSGRGIADLVPPGVNTYIEQEGLYR